MTAIIMYYIPQYAQTTLNVPAGITNSAITGIILASVPSDIDITKPGILCLTYTNPIVTDNAEFIAYTSIDGTNELQGVTRGAEGYSAKAHTNGCTVAWVVSKSHVNQVANALTGVTTGVHLNSGILTTPQINDTSSDHQYIVAGSELIADRTVTLPLLTGNDEFAFKAHTQTFTNKTLIATTNVVEEISTIADSATPTPTGGSLRNFFTVTALAQAATFAAPSGTPASSNKLIIRIKDNATARALSWNAIYRAMGTALPSTTVLSKTLYLGFIFNAIDTKWDLVARGQEA